MRNKLLKPIALWCLCWCVLPVQSQEQQAVTDIGSAFNYLQLQYRASVKGEFVQHKQLKMLKRPLRSSGEFAATAETFFWQQTLPVASRIELQGGQVISTDHLGNQQPIAGAEQFVPLLRALVSQNAQQLTQYLRFAGLDNNCVQFATTAPLSQIFSTITMCGQGQIAYLTLRETSGTESRIELTYAED